MKQKVCVFGAGAVGGYLAAQLSTLNDIELSIVARGEHLRAIHRDGLRIVDASGETRVRSITATDDPATLAPQDVVFVTLKTYAQADAASAVAGLLGAQGVAVFANNGIPWWWNYGAPIAASSTSDGSLPLLDPRGDLWRIVRPERVLGCVVYSTNDVRSPGVIAHAGNNYWLLGEPVRQTSERLDRCADLMARAGLRVEKAADIRKAIWTKALRNGPLSPICSITRRSISQLGDSPEVMAIVDEVVDELALIASSTGVFVDDEVESAKQVARRAAMKAREHTAQNIASDRPSMLQDLLRGRPLETEAILGQPYRFAQEARIECPRIASLLPLLRALRP